ncbi:MAG: ATP-binding protein [Leptospiraceae bacterium]|nr:ATP-binding protein [Leptospiraceae bacterium]
MNFNFFKNSSNKAEIRYYLRDFVVLLLCLLSAITLAESIIFSGNSSADFTDRLLGYAYFTFPFLILALVVSYYYRNYRIKQTGKIRSIIRYRLTIAFIFVAFLPSIPVFILSSNVIGKLVESFYRIDISETLIAAKNTIYESEIEDRKILLARARQFSKNIVGKDSITSEYILKKATESSLIPSEKYYLGFIKANKPVLETQGIFPYQLKIGFEKKEDESFEVGKLYLKNKSFLLVKLGTKNKEDYVILGRRIHLGKEENVYRIINTENAYNTADLWKEKVPFALRLLLGLFSLGMFSVSILISFILARQISRPIVQIAIATQRVSKGETDVALENREEGEMGILIDSFNQMTRDLKAKTEELYSIQRVAAWKEVAQRMAHEIKNPLTPIQLSAERIRRKLDSPNKDKFEEVIKNGTETIIGQVRVLEHLVKEFSEFARMPTPVLINQHLNPIIIESVKLFEGNSSVKFELKLARNLPEVYLDKRLFLGVINNLLKNAVEAITNDTESEYKEGIIKITTKLEKNFLRKFVLLSIEDNGPGISDKLKGKIFEPYFSTKEEHGTGIGLTIVQKTVIDHHGHIFVENSSLGGCKFRIELPIEAG